MNGDDAPGRINCNNSATVRWPTCCLSEIIRDFGLHRSCVRVKAQIKELVCIIGRDDQPIYRVLRESDNIKGFDFTIEGNFSDRMKSIRITAIDNQARRFTGDDEKQK